MLLVVYPEVAFSLGVTLSAAKHLVFSATYENEVLRRSLS